MLLLRPHTLSHPQHPAQMGDDERIPGHSLSCRPVSLELVGVILHCRVKLLEQLGESLPVSGLGLLHAGGELRVRASAYVVHALSPSRRLAVPRCDRVGGSW